HTRFSRDWSSDVCSSDLLKRRPEAIVLPHDHLQKFPDRKPTTHSFGKIDLNQPTDLVGEHTVVYSDLDALNHVNNAKYVEWCLRSEERRVGREWRTQ